MPGGVLHPAMDFPVVTLRYTIDANSKLPPPTLAIMVHRTIANLELTMDYQRIYTDLRTAKTSFADFMDFVRRIYDLGIEKGSVTVAKDSNAACFAAAPLGEQFEYRARQ